ncbi:MAG TPA: hypothetical protein VG940_13925 [Gemmatimonadales bacterium]|nr:hypothetical protein [Gemmatimonadales bacterium]
MTSLADRLFALSTAIRYVATYDGHSLVMRSRPGLDAPSGAESDRYEETIVNPTLLTLLTQRGNIDCGGLEYVLIRYGQFFALVIPAAEGHVTVGLEPTIDPHPLIPMIRGAVAGR